MTRLFFLCFHLNLFLFFKEYLATLMHTDSARVTYTHTHALIQTHTVDPPVTFTVAFTSPSVSVSVFMYFNMVFWLHISGTSYYTLPPYICVCMCVCVLVYLFDVSGVWHSLSCLMPVGRQRDSHRCHSGCTHWILMQWHGVLMLNTSCQANWICWAYKYVQIRYSNNVRASRFTFAPRGECEWFLTTEITEILLNSMQGIMLRAHWYC